MKVFVMFSFIFYILGCSVNNTTEIRFESGCAILWPQWKKSYDSDIRPLAFLIGIPENPASNLDGLVIIFSGGNILRVSSDTKPVDVRKSLDGVDQYDVSGNRGPSLHPGKSYFEWPANTTAIYKQGVITAFFTEGRLVSLSLNNNSDAVDKLTLNEQEFDYPLKLDDLKKFLGPQKETLRYLSE